MTQSQPYRLGQFFSNFRSDPYPKGVSLPTKKHQFQNQFFHFETLQPASFTNQAETNFGSHKI